jgi:serine/alanine adding enzyme
MEIRIHSGNAPPDAEEWNQFLADHPHGTVFQSPAMYDFLRTVPGYSPVLIFATDERERLTGILLGIRIKGPGGLPRSLSTRVVVYGGPLILNGLEEYQPVLDGLLQAFVSENGRSSSLIQFRNFHDTREQVSVFRKNGFLFREHLNLVLGTTNPAFIEEGMSRSRIRQVRKSMESGVTVEPATSTDEVRELFRILQQLYRSRIKKPLPPFEFFESFFRFSGRGQLGVILVAKYANRVIGGMICPVTGKKCMYEWYVCGMDREFRELYPSVMVTWSAIRYAADHGITQFDFMGMGQPQKEYGVRDFKSRFGGTMVNNGRYLRPGNRLVARFAETGYRILAPFGLK